MKTLIFLILLSSSTFAYEKEQNNTFIKYTLTGSYDNVVFALLDELSVNGFILSYRLNIGKSLNKTSNFFEKKELFLNANKIGFCKSTLSLKMMSENSHNLIYCPLAITIYEKKKNHIVILYQKAHVLNKNDQIMTRINNIVSNIIKAVIHK